MSQLYDGRRYPAALQAKSPNTMHPLSNNHPACLRGA
jgi:hypothetical protein